MATTTGINVPNAAKTYLDDGDATTCLVVGTAVVGKRFVKATTGGLGNHPAVTLAVSGGPIYGVAHFDAAVGANVSVLCEGTIEVTAGETLTSGDEVAVGAAGVAVKSTATSQSGTTPFAVTFGLRPVGVCVADTASGAGAPITLYL